MARYAASKEILSKSPQKRGATGRVSQVPLMLQGVFGDDAAGSPTSLPPAKMRSSQFDLNSAMGGDGNRGPSDMPGGGGKGLPGGVKDALAFGGYTGVQAAKQAAALGAPTSATIGAGIAGAIPGMAMVGLDHLAGWGIGKVQEALAERDLEAMAESTDFQNPTEVGELARSYGKINTMPERTLTGYVGYGLKNLANTIPGLESLITTEDEKKKLLNAFLNNEEYNDTGISGIDPGGMNRGVASSMRGSIGMADTNPAGLSGTKASDFDPSYAQDFDVLGRAINAYGIDNIDPASFAKLAAMQEQVAQMQQAKEIGVDPGQMSGFHGYGSLDALNQAIQERQSRIQAAKREARSKGVGPGSGGAYHGYGSLRDLQDAINDLDSYASRSGLLGGRDGGGGGGYSDHAGGGVGSTGNGPGGGPDGTGW